MIKQLRVWLMAVALGLSLAGQANATSYAVGDLSAYVPGYTNTATFAGGASISDSYSFTIPTTGSFSAIAASLGFLSTGINNLTLMLSGPGLSGTYTPNPAGFINTGLLLVPGGSYLANITGTALSGGGIYNIQMAATVPEPSGWMMLLAGFALVGFMVKRRTNFI